MFFQTTSEILKVRNTDNNKRIELINANLSCSKIFFLNNTRSKIIRVKTRKKIFTLPNLKLNPSMHPLVDPPNHPRS